ncbi:MAG: YebC/PmpR family DNA-binding transcriptional regulator [Dehalococcoidia bacterium]|nr:YebC/PmpR family DNA-binding transcriptional regulator [Dehalococcoidia bacterium]
MSGHSKWSQIKRQKGVNDAKRGQIFTKFGREIMVAARQGGPDPESNFRLRLAVQRAKEQNMPVENIDRAIKRASGGAEGVVLEEITYEGYGPSGVAVFVEALTDNRNRTVAEVRNLFTRSGGCMGEAGSVAWLFDARGILTIEPGKVDQDELVLAAIDAGAEDVKIEDGYIEVYTQPHDLEPVRKKMESAGVKVTSADFSRVPKTTVALQEKESLQTLRLMDKLEELDDIQRVYTNADIPDEVLKKYEG